VFQAKDFFTNQQVVVTKANLLIGFSIDRVHNGFLSHEGALGIRCSHQLLADFVAYINDRPLLACRLQSSFSVTQVHSLFNLISPERIQSYRQFFGCVIPRKGKVAGWAGSKVEGYEIRCWRSSI